MCTFSRPCSNTMYRCMPRQWIFKKTEFIYFGSTLLIFGLCSECCNKVCVWKLWSFNMGSISGHNHRVCPAQLLEHTRTLCIALAVQKTEGIQELLRQKRFIKNLIFLFKHYCVFLVMGLISEIVCLRIITAILFVLLVILTIYVLYDALARCREIENKLTEELQEMALLTDLNHED